MTAPRKRGGYHVEADVTPAPNNNWAVFSGANIPLYAVLALIAGGGVWYATTTQSREDIAQLKAKLEEVTKASVVTTKEQDERRAALGEKFLASNKEIATQISEMSKVLAVQQATQQSTSAALTKISDQLQQLNQTQQRHK